MTYPKTSTPPKGLFIVIEGPSGSGKSTGVIALSDYFKQLGSQVLLTREPSENFDRENENKLKGESLAKLYLEDRYWHVDNVILPSIVNGDVIICDRYIPSTMVYQSIEGINMNRIIEENSRFPVPDLTVFLSANESALTKRVEERQSITRFEEQSFRSKEIITYKSIPRLLVNQGWDIIQIDTTTKAVDEIITLINRRLKELKLI
jgi:dTMP kinase